MPLATNSVVTLGLNTSLNTYGGRLLEASDGTVYAVLLDGASPTNLEVWNDVAGTPTLGDQDSATTAFGGGIFIHTDAAIDSNDIIHIISQCNADQTRDIVYNQYDIGAGTLGTWEEIAPYTDAVPAIVKCAITVDSSDIARVLWTDAIKVHGTNRDSILYSRRTGGTWDTPELVQDDAAVDYRRPSITMADADDVEAMYEDTANTNYVWNRRNASWGGETAVRTATLQNSGYHAILNINETINRYTSEGSGSVDIYEDSTDTTLQGDAGQSHWEPAYGLGAKYLAVIDNSDDLRLYTGDGASWSLVTAIDLGTIFGVTCENTFDQLSRDYVHGLYQNSGAVVFYWKWFVRPRVYVISHG